MIERKPMTNVDVELGDQNAPPRSRRTAARWPPARCASARSMRSPNFSQPYRRNRRPARLHARVAGDTLPQRAPVAVETRHLHREVPLAVGRVGQLAAGTLDP